MSELLTALLIAVAIYAVGDLVLFLVLLAVTVKGDPDGLSADVDTT